MTLGLNTQWGFRTGSCLPRSVKTAFASIAVGDRLPAKAIRNSSCSGSLWANWRSNSSGTSSTPIRTGTRKGPLKSGAMMRKSTPCITHYSGAAHRYDGGPAEYRALRPSSIRREKYRADRRSATNIAETIHYLVHGTEILDEGPKGDVTCTALLVDTTTEH